MAASTVGNGPSVDHGAMDSEHRVQLGLVNALCQTLEQGADKATVVAVLDRLVSYTDAHFMAEQLLMRQYAYPLYEAHELEHDRLVEKVHELQRNYETGETQLTLDTAHSLRAWLLAHTNNTDHAFADYLNERILAPKPE